MAIKPITVSQLNEYVSRVLGTDPLLGAVVVKGEIFSLKYHSSGHVYFSIMDNTGKVSCFLPQNYAQSLTFPLSDGQEVILTGAVRVYKKNGTYSLYVRNVELTGDGDLSVAFEEMKKKLALEGLFDSAHKKSIPSFPHRIGIVTSETGAAVRDILKILQSRNHMVDVILFPVLVQGQSAATEIASMIDYIDANYDDIDTLIVGRGGGSADDLWAFNEEVVARSIYNCTIPIISAVGHEIDFTISDFVADRRAETPTAAAVMAVPAIEDIKRNLASLRDDLYVRLSNKLMYHRLQTDNLADNMKRSLLDRIGEFQHLSDTLKLRLEENYPYRIMDSGYAVIQNFDGNIMKSITDIQPENRYVMRFKDGFATCVIEQIGSDLDGKDKI